MKRLLLAVTLLLSPLPALASDNVQALPTVNGSVVIATGNTFQSVLAAVSPSAGRRSLTIQNNNATDNCWITFGALANGTAITAGNAAKASSILLLPGGSYTRYYPYVPSDAIQATCATTSDTLYVDTQ